MSTSPPSRLTTGDPWGLITAEYRAALRGYAAQLTPAALNGLRADSRVLFVSPDVDVVAAADTVPTGVARIQDNGDLAPDLLAQSTPRPR